MNLTPISSSSPTPQEPDRNRVSKRTTRETEASTRETEAVKARGLVSDIGSRLAQLRAEQSSREARVDEALEEMRRGELLSPPNLEQAAESMLFGENPESIPLE